jgi:8-oxo-dGTP pyrophosphatase MutT (NUDIX family)
VSAFRAVESRHEYRGFSSVRIDVVAGPDGQFTREVVEHPDAVAIVALDAQGRVALVRQYRHPLGEDLLELPAGTLDVDGESVEAAAHRELAEEVGLATEVLVPLGRIWNSAGWSDERTTIVLAPRTHPAPRPAGFTAEDEEAVMAIEWWPLDDVVTAALEGGIDDAKTVVGVLRARAALDAGVAADHDAGPDADEGDARA